MNPENNEQARLEGMATVLLAIHGILESSSDQQSKLDGIKAILPSQEKIAEAIRVR